MSEILVIETDESKKEKLPEAPFKLLPDNHPALLIAPDEYDVSTLPNPVMNNLVERLKMTMRLYNGLGLSANQCGVSARLFIIGTDQFQIVCINPKIISTGEKLEKKREGCLSFPGMYLTIPRYDSIVVEFYTQNGEHKTVTMDGLTAQCFQHEMDHMNGKVFTMHVGSLALRLAKERQAKMVKKAKKIVRSK